MSIGGPLIFGNGDLIEIDAAPYHALARVRGISNDDSRVKLHIAFEQGGYLPWSDDTIRVRKCTQQSTQEASPSFDAKILHTSTATALIELIGQTPLDRLPRYQ